MNTNYELNAYRSHELNIQMRTSSGDVINMNFENSQALAMSAQQNEQGSLASFSFASLQQYQFQIDSNGIDEQDQKEIEAFMEIAKPYIDNFMQELSDDQQTTPLNRISDQILREMDPLKNMNPASQEYAKNDIVALFDDSLKLFKQTQKLFDESQKLLDNILKGFDTEFEKLLYA